MIKKIMISIALLATINAYGQLTKEQYISKYYELAVEEMNSFNIPASITLAQGIFESGSGNSDLAVKGNNHFGIKCKKDWTGMTFYKDDDKPNECFRAYNSVEDSYRDHSIFLSSSKRYEKLFTYDVADYKSWAYGLKAAGYATNPKYPQMLIKVIEDYKLYRYDSYGRGKQKYDSENQKKNDPKVVENKIQNLENANDEIISNNLKKIKVDRDFSLQMVSQKYRLPIEKLVEYNDYYGEQMLTIGQNFFLEDKKLTNPLMLHNVKMGETLYMISQMYGVKVDALRKYNGLKPWEQPMVGEKLYLSNKRKRQMKKVEYFEVLKNIVKIPEIESNTNNKSVIQTNVNNNNNIPDANEVKDHKLEGVSKETKVLRVDKLQSHIVGNNDSIFKIAKKYKCTAAEILKWNGLKIEDELKEGQEILIFK